MSTLFGVVRGSFWVQKEQTVTPSIIQITGLKLPTEGALVSNFNVSDYEKHTITQCFKDVNHIYAFGHDPEQSGFSVTYIVFLGESCGGSKSGDKDKGKGKGGSGGSGGGGSSGGDYSKFKESPALGEIVKSYNEDLKLSKHKATVDVTIGTGLTIVGIVLSANVAVYEAETNSVTVTIAGKSLITGK